VVEIARLWNGEALHLLSPDFANRVIALSSISRASAASSVDIDEEAASERVIAGRLA